MRTPTFVTAAIAAAMLTFAPAHAQDSVAVSQDDVLGYLEQLITWQRDAVALEPTGDNPRELIYQDTLHQNSTHVLQSGFKFARAEASHQTTATDDDADKPADQQTPAQRIAIRAQQNSSRITQINSRLNEIAATKTQTPALKTEQGKLQDELKLDTAKQDLLQSVQANISAASTGETKGFLGKVNNLANTIPELAVSNKKAAVKAADGNAPALPSAITAMIPGAAAAAAAASAPAAPSSPHSATSILSLTSDLFDLIRKQRELRDFAVETGQLESASKDLMKTLRTAMDAATDPNPPVPATDADATAQPAPAPMSIDDKVTQFKRIAADVVPLGDATLWIGISKHNITDWQNLLADQMRTLLRSLVIHLALLAITLAIPLAISGFVKRAIKRYVADPKRQRQAQTARRIITGLVVLFVILENFISDFSSFATFAGFLTAGLAVALQSVLLSLVAHFFFYGRYGVRAGDRVNVGGVTGDILQIGMTRFYMREMEPDEKKELKPTGKIVAFPNSILFQNTAFYKYVDDRNF